MAEDRVDHRFGVALLAEDLDAGEGMLGAIEIRVGPAFVIEIVQEAGRAPELFILLELASVETHRRLDRKHMFDEALPLGVFLDQLQGCLPVDGFHCVALSPDMKIEPQA